MYSEIKECIICKGQLSQVLDLGKQFVVDFVKERNEKLLQAPLVLMRCENCSLVQLKHRVNPDRLYKKFWYRSGINDQMKNELLAVVQHAQETVTLKPGDKVLDIGCNDGTLLGWYDKQVMTFGIDPCSSLVGEGMQEKRIDVGIADYFSADIVQSLSKMMNLPNPKFKIITAVAMFYDIETPVQFLLDCKALLHDHGVLVIQMNYLGTMLKDTAIDNICHEHLAYYSVAALETAITKAGLELHGLEFSSSNGGSIRAYITHPEFSAFCPDHDTKIRLIQNLQFTKLAETRTGLTTALPYTKFELEAQTKMAALRRTIDGFTNKKIYAYGASTRGTVLIQYLFQHGGADKIIGVAERDSNKYGLKMVGTWWPIVDEETFRKDAEIALVLPWHFRDSILEREQEWLLKGGRMIFPLPVPQITELNQKVNTVNMDKIKVEAQA